MQGPAPRIGGLAIFLGWLVAAPAFAECGLQQCPPLAETVGAFAASAYVQQTSFDLYETPGDYTL